MSCIRDLVNIAEQELERHQLLQPVAPPRSHRAILLQGKVLKIRQRNKKTQALLTQKHLGSVLHVNMQFLHTSWKNISHSLRVQERGCAEEHSTSPGDLNESVCVPRCRGGVATLLHRISPGAARVQMDCLAN